MFRNTVIAIAELDWTIWHPAAPSPIGSHSLGMYPMQACRNSQPGSSEATNFDRIAELEPYTCISWTGWTHTETAGHGVDPAAHSQSRPACRWSPMVPQKHMLPRNRVEVSCLLVLLKTKCGLHRDLAHSTYSNLSQNQ